MIDLEQKLYTMDGLVLKELIEIKDIDEHGEVIIKKEQADMTLRSALCNALLRDSMRNINIDNVLAKYNLYIKIRNAHEYNFTEEDITLLSEVLIEKYPVFYAGQIINLIKQ
jgi:NACalpha-BTF3-like transcription factor